MSQGIDVPRSRFVSSVSAKREKFSHEETKEQKEINLQ